MTYAELVMNFSDFCVNAIVSNSRRSLHVVRGSEADATCRVVRGDRFDSFQVQSNSDSRIATELSSRRHVCQTGKTKRQFRIELVQID